MTPRFSIYLATLLLGATVLHGCLAAQLRPVTARMCAESMAAVEFCEAGSCANSSMRNTHDEEWATLDEWKRDAEQDCKLHEAVEAGRVKR